MGFTGHSGKCFFVCITVYNVIEAFCCYKFRNAKVLHYMYYFDLFAPTSLASLEMIKALTLMRSFSRLQNTTLY